MPASIADPQFKITKSATSPAVRGKLWLRTGEFLLLGIIAVFVLEWFFNMCGIGQQEFLQPDPKLGCRHIPGKLVVWRMEGFSSDRLSSSGLRDVEHAVAKPAGVTRIALLGDSATEGLQVPLRSTFARVLESELNTGKESGTEVFNFGCSSYSTGQQLLQLQNEVMPYEPDAVVLLYVRGSSLQNVRDPSKPNAEPRPYFYSDNNNQAHVDYGAISPSQARPNAVLDFLRKNSRIYGVFTQTDLALSIHEKWYRNIRGFATGLFSLGTATRLSKSASAGGSRAAPTLTVGTESHQIILDSLGRRLPGGAGVPPASVHYPKPDAWKVTRSLITSINDECKRHHIRFILMLFPNTLRDPEYDRQIIELGKLSKQEGFGYLDLTPPFTSHADPNSLFLQYHFSAAGHKLVADELRRYLEAFGNSRR